MLEKWVNRCWYQRKLPGLLLAPLSWLFALIAWSRRRAYQTGWLTCYRSSLKVIVVGNITVGGTGKTPVVLALIAWFKEQARPVAVISRGYGRLSRDLCVISAETLPQSCGDEPLLIFLTTGVPVIVASTRVEAIRYCERHFPHHVIICDDGLQHYALARDIEIAVIDGQRGFGNGRLLPAGPLREPITRLTSVDFTLINGGQLSQPRAYILQLVPQRFVHLATGRVCSLSELQAMGRWLALTAIGNPSRFFDSLRSFDLSFDEVTFADHYLFKRDDLLAFRERLVMVTAKDAVKLRTLAFDNIYVLEVEAAIPMPFYQALLTQLNYS